MLIRPAEADVVDQDTGRAERRLQSDLPVRSHLQAVHASSHAVSQAALFEQERVRSQAVLQHQL